MNYYPFHVGDYAAHTAHLEPMEDLAYRRLLDQYYLRECPLPADIQATAKLVRMRSCVVDVEAVLNEFFVLTEDGWKHSRCDAEIERMQDKQAKARASAQASVNARKAKSLNVRSTDGSDESSERSTDAEKKQTDVELPTPTPTPIHSATDVAGGPAAKSADEMTKDELWSAGKSLLQQGGMPVGQCGSFVGKLVKDYGQAIVVEAVRTAVVERPADPASYLKAACLRSSGIRAPVNRQEALEARTQAIADSWVPPELRSAGGVH